MIGQGLALQLLALDGLHQHETGRLFGSKIVFGCIHPQILKPQFQLKPIRSVD
jgi:hypothetical protein